MASMNEDLQQQLIQDLLVESYEGLDRFDNELLQLEKGGASAETMNQIFRIIHTIKGTSGCIGLGRIEKLAHSGENLLDELRSGERQVHSGIVSLLLKLSDTLRSMLQHLEASGNEGDNDYSALLEQLKSPPAAEITAPAPAEPQISETSEDTPYPASAAQPAEATVPDGWGLFDEDPAPAAESGTPRESATPTPPTNIAPGPAKREPANDISSPAPEAVGNKPSIADSAIRVDVNQLDKLMNLVGELVLARNQILQFTTTSNDNALLNTAQRLNIITTELQEGVMKTRMQQIGSIWSKYPRVIRDLSHDLGKKVELVMDGQETELDRTVIESVKDPLMHILRNSVDHGLELPEKRRAAGKPETGLLVLRAFHEGGQVNIEISDDGAGINVPRVKAKAVERGIITNDQAARMSDREAHNLIFAPGFSTAEKVTNVSGRGVGMDVVKTNIEKIGGSVDVHSEPGRSTTIKIKIPLTLAIIPALIVTAGGERFAIPQVSLVELVRLEDIQARKSIEMLYGAPVYRLRGKLLPLVYLKGVLARDAGNAGDLQAKLAGKTGDVFARARDAHRAWLVKLRQFLDGKLTMSDDEAGSHQICQLGKWIYSDGLPNYGDIREVVALEKCHQQFHLLVREIVATKNADTTVDCEAKLRQLDGLSNEVLDLLTRAENRIHENQVVNIVVLQADGRQFGLVVDQINDTEEIVVKPLAKQLKSLICFAGATIMGDGCVALILDVLGLAQHSHVVSGTRDQALADERTTSGTAEDEKQALLLFDVGGDSRIAIPLSLVARLEEIESNTIENAAGQEVVQYRGQIMPLIRVGDFIGTSRSGHEPNDGDGSLQVVVYSEHGRSVGLVVSHINDIVEEHITIRRDGRGGGIAGSAVIHDRVTDLLDVPDIIRRADPDFYSAAVNA